MQKHGWRWEYILLGICEVGVGFRFPSISLHKKLSQLLVEEWGASPADPALLLHFSETILSKI